MLLDSVFCYFGTEISFLVDLSKFSETVFTNFPLSISLFDMHIIIILF